ncbi:MAG: alpha/beta fold hydrolase [Deltaproteobacteria bacterium]|nr:alpha/beta fold hydrolase [Deltaproteobacteria bacterium]
MNTAVEPTKPDTAMDMLLAGESALFIKEYEKNYSAGESKPPDIGMPFFLHSPGSDTGVLLIHGLMAAPEEVKEWAQFLHEKGLTVYVPRLSGHGTSSKDLSIRNYNDWMDSVDRGHAILRKCCKKIMVAGFSTGAGLALQSVILKPHDFEAVITVSAPLKFKSFSSRFAELLNGFNIFCNYLGMSNLAREYMKNDADNPHINYLRCPVSAFVQVKKLMKKVRRSLPNIFIPVLVLQAKNDPKVAPGSGPAIFKLLGTDKKHFSWIDYHMHGIVREEIAIEVFKEVESFLAAYGLINCSK